MLSTHAIERFEELQEFAPQWDALAHRSARTPFQTPQWNLAWWELVGKHDASLRLHVLVLTQAGTVCALAPLVIKNTGAARVLAFLSDPYADYLDIIVDASAVEPHVVYKEVCEHIRQGFSKLWDSVELREVPEDSGLCAYVRRSADAGRGLTLSESSECPKLQLDDDAAFDRAVNIKEYIVKQRRLSRLSPLVCRHFTETDEISARMPLYREMHLRQWLPRPNCGITFNDAVIVRFYDETVRLLAPHGLMMLTELMLGGQPVAYYYGFIYKRVYWAYRPAFETAMAKYSPGGVMHRFLFLHLREQNFVAFDFMRGSFAYKFRYANVSPKNSDVLINRAP
jgi:CelD/BcsL family acetyltransferase involved in cellulose biosynthesis